MTKSKSPRAVKREDTENQTNDTSADVQVNDAAAFMRIIRPNGPRVLSAIVPDGRISTCTFRRDQFDTMQEWIAAHDGYRNLYFQVNSSGDAILHKKATKADIVRAEWLHVDIDGDKEAAWSALREFQPQPQIIIDSGGGYQAFWRIAPTSDLDDVEAINRWLASELGGDHCHNIDRIMRLPFTTNLPNKKKRQSGRLPVPATLLRARSGLTALSEMGRLAVPKSLEIEIRAVGEWVGRTDALFLNEALPPWAFRMLRDPRDSNGQPFTSRSEHVWAFVGACVRDGVIPELIRWCLLNPDFPVSGHVLDQKDPERCVTRTIARMEAQHGYQ
ncbi:DNA-primase RepB domain-containing protein [Altererythrobacter lutimaris]|uniref:RepB-like DNA primase domain-containing protein n=1 Tax=Altererythrobacter lutimaris TaxID=2743979 RepID=A0A850HE01_9SPHN|nr:DNA-primase RepB domain-containing protein [Altererythrobacter lutimaris]NVE95890.1 hypothetical protein [Altererythrobacter lutimaris]